MFLVPKILDTADVVTGESKFDQMLNSNLMAKLQLGRLGWIKWRPGRELNGWGKLTKLLFATTTRGNQNVVLDFRFRS